MPPVTRMGAGGEDAQVLRGGADWLLCLGKRWGHGWEDDVSGGFRK